ncbi:uncharacterized protein LOC117175940 [Belonocnema kinseyi]|uniref:uncharacterized protein LOC117175940 n=1 Tax=Belonocnema kinseyi TaxID=2817044 RepID=UPI00143D1ADB|nr:uncharacterized protein LOC117175940 [Belonocnema kinseyi]
MEIFGLTLRLMFMMIFESVQSRVSLLPQSTSPPRSPSPPRFMGETIGGPIIQMEHTDVVCRGENILARYDAFHDMLVKLNAATGHPELVGSDYVTIPLTDLVPGDLLVTPRGYIYGVYEVHGEHAGFRQLPEDQWEHWRQYLRRRYPNHA